MATDIYKGSLFDRHYDEDILISIIEETLVVKTLVAVIENFYSDDIKEYDEMVSVLIGRGSYSYTP